MKRKSKKILKQRGNRTNGGGSLKKRRGAGNNATKEDDVIVIDVTELGYNKVLATGNLDAPMVIKSPDFSENARFKIEEAGGEAVDL